jgi:hypothetical protein
LTLQLKYFSSKTLYVALWRIINLNYELMEEGNGQLSDGILIKWNHYRGDLVYNRYSDIFMLSNLFLLIFIIMIPSNIYSILAFASLGLFNILFWFRRYNSYRIDYTHWVKVPASVNEVWVDEYHLIKASNIFCPRVKYTYNFRNHSYFGTQLAHDKFDYCKQSRKSVVQAIEKLKNENLHAWVDPKEPSNAVLNNGMSTYQSFQYGFILSCGLLFATWSIYLAVQVFTS